MRTPELLAPAGGPEAGYAALAYGADAVYLGLKRFSARAEADNFGLAELDALAAYAHALSPRRRVFVTVNTLVLEAELPELVATLAGLRDAGADAVIVQDLGVARIVRRHFPTLDLHASTQMAVHSRRGVDALARLGVRRVVAARELTLEELRSLSAQPDVEIECFVHGAICYAWSGLCLFSSHALGRSANRGRCAYVCGGSFAPQGEPGRSALPFAMKDLALPDRLADLAAAGVASLKIEGRKKSPLYVAAVTDLYRGLLDGTLTPEERRGKEEDLRTIFSRPWTELYLSSPAQRGCGDPRRVGHRGALVGEVAGVRGSRRTGSLLRFRTSRALEVHDGLQVEVPGLVKPYGFPIGELRVAGAPGRRFEVGPGTEVEIPLPADHPTLPAGAAVHCTSSQAVKRAFRWTTPRDGEYRSRRFLDVDARVGPDGVRLRARLGSGEETVQTLGGPFEAARVPGAAAAGARAAFERLGNTPFALGRLEVADEQGLFVAASQWNRLRRTATDALEASLAEAREGEIERVLEALRGEGGYGGAGGGLSGARAGGCDGEASDGGEARGLLEAPAGAEAARGSCPPEERSPPAPATWSLRVDRLDLLGAFEAEDWAAVGELVWCLDAEEDVGAALPALAERLGREKIRLALPPVARQWDETRLVPRIEDLLARGWRRWEIANLAGWGQLGLAPGDAGGLDLTADWPLYAVNSAAAAALLELGVSGFTLSPEDGADNLKALLAAFGSRATVVVYQHTPLFLSETCPRANRAGGCPGPERCGFQPLDLVSDFGDRVRVLNRRCRTVVLSRAPFCLAEAVGELTAAGARSLRVDLEYADLTSEEARDTWRRLRAGGPVPGTHAGNYRRGLL